MPSPPMSWEEFRRHGHALVDWVADLLSTAPQRPIRPDVEPGWVRAQLPPSAPERGEPFEDVVADLDRVITPALTQWQHPGWFAYFPGNTSPPSILGELVAAGTGQQGMLWSTSPAATELESHVLDWLVDLLGLPASWKVATGPGGGVIQGTASEAAHTSLVVARHLAVGTGAATDEVVAYTSAQAHSSVEKGARIAAYRHVRLIDVDEQLAMRSDALRDAIERDAAAGLRPAHVTSTVGTTGTTAVDPVRTVGELAREHGLWHHVDAAYAGTAMICPEFRHHQDGLELVDSYTFNPHKWMFTNVDCSVFYVADRAPLIDTMSIVPPYLRDRASASGAVVDYRDWHVALGRRFRALKLWFVLRTYGAQGIRAAVREHVQLAGWLADRLDADRRFELVAPVPFGLVSFRHVDGDAATDGLVEAVNASGDAYVTPSDLPDGRRFVRVSVGQTDTREEHVERLWALIDAAA